MPASCPFVRSSCRNAWASAFGNLDVPLLVEWPNRRREAILFVLEEESDTRRFSIHRLAHYALHLAEMFDTDRVVPVVIFLRRAAGAPRSLRLGGDHHTYLDFRYLRCDLAELPFERYRDSDNLVARLNLPNMHYTEHQKVEVYAQAVRGLTRFEPDPENQLKYLDYIDIYGALDDNERAQYERDYPDEVQTMSKFAERFRQEGFQEGKRFAERFRQEGMQQGEARVLARLLQLKFGELPEEVLRRIEQADEQTLLAWSERVLTASHLDDVLH